MPFSVPDPLNHPSYWPQVNICVLVCFPYFSNVPNSSRPTASLFHGTSSPPPALDRLLFIFPHILIRKAVIIADTVRPKQTQN